MFDTIDWQKAESTCVKYGGHLASFHSKAEWDFVKESIAKQELWYKDSYWIGLKATGSSGFRWSDQTVIDYSEETTLDSSLVINAWEKCIYVTKGEWKQADCHAGNFLDYSYICKFTPTVSIGADNQTRVKIDGECIDGWTKHQNWCRKVFGYNETEWLSWSSALKHCKLYHQEGSLVTVHSKTEQVEITSMLRGLRANPWIGLKRVLGEYRWADVTALKGFDNWFEGEPLNRVSDSVGESASVKICVSASVNKMKPGKWITALNCDEVRPFVCQVLPDKNLPKVAVKSDSACKLEGYQHYGTSCYKMFENELLGWKRADDRCAVDGGHLISISDGFEQSFIQTLTWKSKSLFFWTGLSDNAEFLFEWSNGDNFTFDNWNTLEPGLSNSPRCVALERNNGKWVASNCSLSIEFICQIKNITGSEEESSLRNRTNLVCPFSETVSWIDVGTQSCFYLENKRQNTWQEAKLDCSTNGGKLANLHNAEELEKLRNSLSSMGIRGSFWIGFYEDQEDIIRWTDQVPFNSLINKPGSPDLCFQFKENSEDFMNCLISRIAESRRSDVVEFGCGEWSILKKSFDLTAACADFKPFLCQISKIPSSNESTPTSEPNSTASLRSLFGVTTALPSRTYTTTYRETPTVNQTTPSNGTPIPMPTSVYRYNVTGNKEKLVINHKTTNENHGSSIVVIVVLTVLSLVFVMVGVLVWFYRKRRSRVIERDGSFSNNLFETSDTSVLSFTNRMCET